MSEAEHYYKMYLTPNRGVMHRDPFGYAAAASEKWKLLRIRDGVSVPSADTQSQQDLQAQTLWLTQARALSYAASQVLLSEPDFGLTSPHAKSICDSQFCAVGLMLLGYSLEASLKGMTVIDRGVDFYRANEKQFHHHRLDLLSEIVPNLNEKDKAILLTLSYFTTWAGRYPDPGKKREVEYEQIYAQSEKFKINFADVLDLAKRVMAHAETFLDRVVGSND